MNERIRKAIKDYEKAQTEYTIANNAAKLQTEEARRAWDRIPAGDFKSRKESPEMETAMEESRKETEANKLRDLATAILYAASQNVANTAANVIREEMQKSPEKFNIPTHYKKFSAAIDDITGGDGFYFSATWNTVYIYFSKGNHGHNEAFIIAQSDDHIIEAERIKDMKPAAETDLKTIKKEAKKAQKDAEKLRKAYTALYEKAEAIREEYESNIKYFLPRMDSKYLKDEYRLF